MPVAERFGPTRRGGPVFRWLGEPLAIDLANTVMVIREDGDDEVDLLSTPAELERWLCAEGERLQAYEAAAADLGPIRELRDAVRGLLTAAAEGDEPPQGDLNRVNAASAAAPIAPRLALAGGRAVRAEAVAAGVAPLPGLLGALARAAIELLAETPEAELRICRAPSCGMFYLGARRWCCSACGNRARAARHYRRHRAAPPRRGAPAAG
jgi:predicted RNA-binding Zn ribbon-like protein